MYSICIYVDGGFFYWYVLSAAEIAFTLINVAKRIIFSIITHNMHDITAHTIQCNSFSNPRLMTTFNFGTNYL